MECNVWFQHENFESDEQGEIIVAKAIEYFNGIDWDIARQKFEDALNVSKDDCCPPGFGLIREDESFMHFYADDPTTWELLIRFKTKDKFLGFIPKPAREYHYRVSSLEALPKLIELFYEGDNDKLIQECNLKLT